MIVCVWGEKEREGESVLCSTRGRGNWKTSAIDEITLEGIQTNGVSGNDLEPFHAGPFVPIPNTFQSNEDI